MLQRIFETHLKVQSLAVSMPFYAEVLGLTLGTFDAQRRIAFYWVGGRNVSMLGLWETAAPIPSQHFAFQIDAAALPAAIANLQAHGVRVYNFLDDGTAQPMVFAWMPALALYFRDPDDHELELIAPLPEPPRPALGVISPQQWAQAITKPAP